MARSFDSGALTYAGIAIVLLVAIAAMAMYRFDLFQVRSLLEPQDDAPPEITRPGNHDPGRDRGGDDPSWSTEPPDFSEYRIERDTPLPERLVLTRSVHGHSIQIELRLVPQGPFIMGRNNGVVANSPQRWVWMDDYYLSTTEITNDQFFAFVLDGGYDDPVYWTQEGYTHVRETLDVRGSSQIRWVNLGDPSGRLNALTAPSDESGSRLTLEVRDADLVLGEKDRTVLVLPNSVAWTDYVDVDPKTGTVRVRTGDERWSIVDGQDLRYDRELKARGLLFTTDSRGQVNLSDMPDARFYRIVAFADGDFEKPLIGQLQRGGATYLRMPDIPAVGLTWYEADAVCRYFGGELPTEAQWEKAGRGTDGRIFPWGNDLEMDQEFVDINGARRTTTPRANVNRWEILPVGSFPDGAGPWGHLDLVGNASEWCRDVYRLHPDPSEANPVTLGGARERRSERGSSTVDDDVHTSKLFARRALDPYSRGKETRGFRIVFDPETALRLARRE